MSVFWLKLKAGHQENFLLFIACAEALGAEALPDLASSLVFGRLFVQISWTPDFLYLRGGSVWLI